jgi:hypothetical protein
VDVRTTGAYEQELAERLRETSQLEGSSEGLCLGGPTCEEPLELCGDKASEDEEDEEEEEEADKKDKPRTNRNRNDDCQQEEALEARVFVQDHVGILGVLLLVRAALPFYSKKPATSCHSP